MSANRAYTIPRYQAVPPSTSSRRSGSTFAWYQADKASVSAATTKANIETATSYTLEGVVLTVDWSNSGSFSNIALTDNNGDVWAYNGATDNLVKAQLGTKVRGAVVTVTLGLPAGIRSDQQAAIAGNYTVTVTKSDDNGRLKTIDSTTLPEVGTDHYKDATITFQITIPSTGSWTTNNSKTFVVAYAGEQATAGNANKDTEALTGKLGVSI